jgi:hypothetical protein
MGIAYPPLWVKAGCFHPSNLQVLFMLSAIIDDIKIKRGSNIKYLISYNLFAMMLSSPKPD